MERLPRHDRLELCLEPGCPSAQGFTHLGFPVLHTFTYRSSVTADMRSCLRDAHQKTRNVVIRAQKACSLERNTDLDRFLRLHLSEFAEGNRIDYAVLKRAFTAAAARGQVEILFAKADDGRDLAAAIVLADKTTLYYWLSTRDPAVAMSGASALLVFEAVKLAYATGRTLDLDGYATPGQGVFLMKFGLEPVVRPYISYGSGAWRWLNLVTTAFRPQRGDRYFRV